MSRTIALIPAKKRSTGIVGKNFRTLGDRTLWRIAADCGAAAGCDRVVLSCDVGFEDGRTVIDDLFKGIEIVDRPAELATDTTPMFDVVKHAADALALADDDVIVLLQPTQPFRTPAHVQEAVRLLRETQADSVVSVVELPSAHHPLFVLEVSSAGYLRTYAGGFSEMYGYDLGGLPRRRQDTGPVYIRDGTVYALWGRTLSITSDLYGDDVRPLIIPPEQSCEMDSEADWQAVERRWKEPEDGR